MFGFGSMLKDYLEFNNISQSDFASRLGITKKHMNEILNEKTDISEDLMIAISLVTDIDVNLITFVETKKKIYYYLVNRFKTENEIKKFINSYYLKEMEKKNWIKLKDKTSFLQNAYDLLKFLNFRNFDVLEKYSNEKILYKKRKDADSKKVFLWISRCDNLVKDKKINEYKSSYLNNLLEALKEERVKTFDESKLVSLFEKHGIYLVIEDALPGTKVRGATKVFNNNPAIYMTKYLKEKSSFYFALYHELCHVKSDYNKAKSKVIIDGDDDLEKKCDKFALNQMINDEIYGKILEDINNAEKICKENKIPLCFLYSRLAKEGKIKYNNKFYIKNREQINY